MVFPRRTVAVRRLLQGRGSSDIVPDIGSKQRLIWWMAYDDDAGLNRSRYHATILAAQGAKEGFIKARVVRDVKALLQCVVAHRLAHAGPCWHVNQAALKGIISPQRVLNIVSDGTEATEFCGIKRDKVGSA